MKCPCCGAAELIHDTRDLSLYLQRRNHHHPGGDRANFALLVVRSS